MTKQTIKKITWKTIYISKDGYALQHFLNKTNFQPGKFIVLEGDKSDPDSYKIVYVDKEEKL